MKYGLLLAGLLTTTILGTAQASNTSQVTTKVVSTYAKTHNFEASYQLYAY